MSELTFRKAAASDASGIYNVMKKVGYASFAYPKKSPEDVIDDIKSSLSKKTYLVCLDGSKVIGYSIFGPFETFGKQLSENPAFPKNLEIKGYVYSLGIGVDPDYQGRDIGFNLKLFTVDEAKKQKYKGMYTDASSNNIKSIKLQEKTGFRKIAEFPDPKRKDGSNTVLFVKEFR